MKKLSLALSTLVAGGCTMMVNGKPTRIGGGPDPVAAEAQPTAAPQPTGAPGQQPAPAARQMPPGQIIPIDPNLGRDPLVLAFDAAFDTTWSKVFGMRSNSPDCGLDIPSRPIGSFEIARPDSDLTISVIGGGNDGFVVRKGDLYWSTCTSSIGDVPTMGPVKDGWQPGRYDIFPVARYNHKQQPMKFQVELYKPNAPIAAAGAQKLVISAKLDKPLFVEVTTQPNRRALRDYHSGYNCGKTALPPTADLALTIERPIPGLTIRPLPSVTPVMLRREKPGDDQHRAEKGCIKGGSRNRDQPSYTADSELRFDKDEGTFGISLGTPDAAQSTKVTLMVFDASTKFDAMTVRPFGGENPTLAQRWVGFQMPQLDADDLGSFDSYARVAQSAQVFAAMPKQTLVYAKLTFDKDIGGADGFPEKNEPLVVLGLDDERVKVMTVDGFRFSVKASHLVLAPDGPLAVPTAPRTLSRKLDIGATIALLPPSDKKLGEAHYKAIKARDNCLDRAWEPYRRQLPSISRPSNVQVIVYKSARTNQIEEAGARAMDKQCGTRQAFDKKTEAARLRLMVNVEKGRAKLLAQATANLR